MAHHERTLTPRTFSLAYSDIPNTTEAYHSYLLSKSVESFAEVAKSCIIELSESQSSNYTLPKDLVASLFQILSEICLEKTAEAYAPCLQLLQILLSSSIVAVPPNLVHQLCFVLADLRNREITFSVINTSFSIVDALYHLALSRRKKTESLDSSWIYKIFNTFAGLLTDLILDSDMKELAMAQYCSNQNRASIDSRIIKTNMYTDMILYLIVALTQLAKFLSTSVSNDFFYVTMPNLFMHVCNELLVKPVHDFSRIHMAISLEKSVNVLTLLNTICVISAKQDIGRLFAKSHSEKIKDLFMLTIFESLKNKIQPNSNKYEEDESVIGRFFNQLSEFFTNNLIHSEMEGLPITIFTIFLEMDISHLISSSKFCYIQAFSMSFLLKYVQFGLKKIKIIETGLVDFMFSKNFFEISDNNLVGNFTLEKWADLWEILINNSNNHEWISSSISRQINFYQGDFEYLRKMNSWIHEQFEANPQFLELFIEKGLLEEMLATNFGIERNIKNIEFMTEFFIMIKSIICMLDFNIPKKTSEKIVEIMMQESLIYDEKISELTLSCLVLLMRYQEIGSYFKYLDLMKNAKSFEITKKLLECVQEILKESYTKKQCQENFVSAGILELLKEILEKSWSQENPAFIWVSVLESIRFLIHENDFCKESLGKIDFFHLGTILNSESFHKKVGQICVKSIESLLYILFQSTNLEIVHEIATPQAIPLVISMLCNIHCDFSDYVLECIKNPFNAIQFSLNPSFSILLNGLSNSENPKIHNFIKEILENTIFYNLHPQDLKKIITTACKSAQSTQTLIFKGINSGFSKAFYKNFEQNSKFPQYKINETNYAWFRNFSNFIQLSSDNFELLPKKEFTIVVWACPLSQEKGCLFEFIDGKSHFSVYVLNSSIEVVLTIDRKIIFKASTEKCLINGKWNLICIGFQTVTKIMSSAYTLEIFANDRICAKNMEGRLSGIAQSFSVVYLGNNSDLKCNFSGKISTFSVFSKFFSDFSCIYECYDDVFLPFIPESLSIFQEFDQKACKELNKFKHLDYLSHFHMTSTETVLIKSNVFVVNGINIVNSLNTLGGLQSFLPIFKDTYLDNDLVLEIFKTFVIFTRSNSLKSLISKDFFDIFSNIIEKIIMPSENLLCLISELLQNLDWCPSLQRNAFISLLLQPKFWKSLPNALHGPYLSVISQYSSIHIDCKLSHCALLYSHIISINPIPISFFSNLLSKILPSEKFVTPENLDAILFLLFKMTKDSPEVLSIFLDELSMIKIDKTCGFDLLYVSVYLIESTQKFSNVQAGLLRVLKNIMACLISNLKEKNLDDFLIFAIKMIDKNIEKVLSLEVYQAIFDIVIFSYNYSEKQISNYFLMFIDLITNRFQYLSPKIQDEMIKATSDYQFCVLIIERENFPNWLSDFVLSTSSTEIYFPESDPAHRLVLQIFTQSQKLYLPKFRSFLLSLSRLNINKPLFYYKSVFEVLKNQKSLEAPVNFLLYTTVLEDLLNPDLGGRTEINIDLYVEILDLILNYALELSIVHCTYPPLFRIDFSNQYDLLKQKNSENIANDDSFYIREGGFLRLVLKFLFIGLQIKPLEILFEFLRIVLKAGVDSNNFLELNHGQKQNSDKILYEALAEKNLSYYSRFSFKETELFFTEEFINFYLLAELTELLNSVDDQTVIDFTLLFLQDSNIDKALILWSKKITNKELEDFFKMIREYKFLFFSTSRLRLSQMERNLHLQLMNGFSQISFTNFQTNLAEQAEFLTNAKKNEFQLKKLLTSPNWITRVHFFLIAFTSMRLNFIATMARNTNLSTRKISLLENLINYSEDYTSKLNSFITFKQEDLRSWQCDFTITQEEFQLINSKKLLSIFEEYHKIETVFIKGKIKIRRNLDAIGRMGCCVKMKNKERFSLRPSKTITMPTENVYRTSIMINLSTDTSVNESVDESELGTVIVEAEEEIEENPLPVKSKTLRCECEIIKIAYSIFGEIELSQDFFKFVSTGKEKPTEGKYLVSALKFTQEPKKNIKFFETCEVSEVFARRFIHRHTAFEVYLRSGKSYFFNVFTAEIRDTVFEIIKSWKHVRVYLELNSQTLKPFTKKWKKCMISNLEYLLILNKFASRSFNDISQYPIFPWVLKDYHSSEIKYEDPHIYRNFKYPIGAQTEMGRQEADRKYSMWIDEQPYHFGSHYSNGAVVLHYLVRIEPFSTQARVLQGGKFDVADRLFHSIEASWESGQGQTSDVKELTPELFYLPEIFINANNEDLGLKQDEEEVSNVELPRWASSPVDFVRKHRLALESNHVSQNIHQWIDLVFGCKQRGKQAQNAYNVFAPMSYEENFGKVLESEENTTYLQGIIEQVVHFGQTPVKIFKNPHPVRDIKGNDQNIFDKYRKFQERVLNGCETNGEICALLMTSKYLLLIKKVHEKMSMIRIFLNEFDNNRVIFEKKREKFLLGSVPLKSNSQEFYCVWGENRIVSAYQQDKSFKIHNLDGALEFSVHCHTDYVTSVCSIGSILITGSADSFMYSWHTVKTSEKIGKICIQGRFLGHVSQIVQIRGLEIEQICVSLGFDGTLLVHDLRNGELLRGIKTNAIGICLSSLGLIGMITENEFNVVSLSEINVFSKKIKIDKAIFDNSGENLYYCSGKNWGFFNLFDEHKKFEQNEEFKLIHLALPFENQYFIYSQLGDDVNFVLTFEILTKESYRVIRRHNILQD